jgi:large subunit ribosomal protein L25
MTNTNTLGAVKRDDAGKGVARKLRASGRVPAVLYGKDMESVSLTVDAREAGHLFQAISVENTIVDLRVEGVKEGFQTLVREIQSHPVRADLIHIDFLRIQKGVMVDVDIPVHLEGIPAGVKLESGTLEQIIHELPVRCIPSKIPEFFKVDVTALAVGDSLHVSDISVPEDVEVTIDLERTLCAVAAQRAEEVVEVDEDALELEEGVEGEEGAAEEGEDGEDEAGAE